MGKAPAEMTVAVIKKELEARGLDTKGLKAVLVARLEEALAGDATGDAAPAAEPAAPEETPAEEPKPEVRIHPPRSFPQSPQERLDRPGSPRIARAKPNDSHRQPTINHPQFSPAISGTRARGSPCRRARGARARARRASR